MNKTHKYESTQHCIEWHVLPVLQSNGSRHNINMHERVIVVAVAAAVVLFSTQQSEKTRSRSQFFFFFGFSIEEYGPFLSEHIFMLLLVVISLLRIILIFRSLRLRCAHVLRSMQIFPSLTSCQCHGFCDCFCLPVQYMRRYSSHHFIARERERERGTRCCSQTNKYAANGWRENLAYKCYMRESIYFVRCLRRKRGRRNMDIFDLFGFWFCFSCSFHHLFIHFVCSALILTARDSCLKPRCGCAFHESHATMQILFWFFCFSFLPFPPFSHQLHSFPIRSVVVAVKCGGRHSRGCFFLCSISLFSFTYEMRVMWTDVIHTVDVFISKKVDAIF